MRRSSVVLAILCGLLALPASVSAAPIQVTSGGPEQLTLTADAGNDFVELESFSGTAPNHTLVFESASQFTEALAGCELSASDTKVTCTGFDSQFYVFLDAGSDTFKVTPESAEVHAAVFGGPGHDDITGGEGSDFLLGGANDDILEGRGGGDTLDGYVGEGNPQSGTDAADILIGGEGGDRMYDSGATAGDRVSFSAEGGRANGVTVTLDGVANDGHPSFDGPSAGSTLLGADDVDAGIEWVQGTSLGDDVTGDAANNILQGSGGGDTLTGRDGHDDLFGGSGDDTLNARDSDDDTADTTIDCGTGLPDSGSPGDVANIDKADPDPIECATVNEFPQPATGGGGGGGGGGSGGGGSGGGGSQGPPPGATTPTQSFPPPPAATDPVALRTALATIKDHPTKGRVRMPRLVGRKVNRAREALTKLGIDADLTIREVAAPRKGISIGTVAGQSPPAGRPLTSDAANRVTIRLDVVEGPRGKGNTCPAAAAELKALKGTDLDLVQELLEARGCKEADLKLVESAKATDPVAQKVAILPKGNPQVTVAVPTATKRQDLFLIVREAALTRSDLQGPGLDWTLPIQPSAVGAQVVDRAGRLVRNAEVTFDLNGVSGTPRSPTFTTREQGQIGDGGADAGGFRIGRAGVVNVLIKAADRTGQALWGSAQIRVADRGQTEWMTTVGRAFLGGVCRVGVRSPSGGGCVTDWLGGREIPDEGYGTRPRVGPEAPAFEAQYARMVPVMASAVAFDAGAVRLLESGSLSGVNKMRVLAGEGRYLHVPAQLAVRGSEPLAAAPGVPTFVKGKLWALEGGTVREYNDSQISASQDGVLVSAKSGQWSTAFGLGRAFDNPSGLVDAKRAEIVRFPDGTGALSTGTVPPAAGAAGVVAVWGR